MSTGSSTYLLSVAVFLKGIFFLSFYSSLPLTQTFLKAALLLCTAVSMSADVTDQTVNVCIEYTLTTKTGTGQHVIGGFVHQCPLMFKLKRDCRGNVCESVYV